MIFEWLKWKTHEYIISLVFKDRNCHTMEFWCKFLFEGVWGCFKAIELVFGFQNSASIYRERLEGRSWSDLQDHMLWLGWIVNEAILKIIVPMLSTRKSRVVRGFKHNVSDSLDGVWSEGTCLRLKDLTLCIKLAFQEWHC